MQKFFFLFLIPLFLTGCRQNQSAKNSITESSVVEEDFETLEIKELRQEYIRDYSKVKEFFDSCEGQGEEVLLIWGKYYCLFDSGIVVPGKYNLDDTTRSFTTHNFAEDIVVTNKVDTIVKLTIAKKDFSYSLPAYLKDYAIIFEPKFNGYDSVNDAFNFSLSVSIPLTDVGKLINLSVDRKGKILLSDKE